MSQLSTIRKPHPCACCRAPIPAGARAELRRAFSPARRKYITLYLCESCADRSALNRAAAALAIAHADPAEIPGLLTAQFGRPVSHSITHGYAFAA